LHSLCWIDIGAETPEEIALSIIAEIKAVLAGRNGGSLKK
jgi:xanthine/CO dehydrogenase XdhC/CoxF family maturation factor